MNELLESRAPPPSSTALRGAGTYKRFNVLESPQGPVVHMAGRGRGASSSRRTTTSGSPNHPEVVQAGIEGLERYGAGTASVRFICGTFAPHLELERELAAFSGTEAALTYVSCWNANEALIPTLADAHDGDPLRRAEPRVDHRRDPAREARAQGALPRTPTWTTLREGAARRAAPTSSS